MTKQELQIGFGRMARLAERNSIPSWKEEDYKIVEEINFLISAHGGEAEQKRTVDRLDFDEWVDFLWHSLNRKDHDLLRRRLKYILEKLNHKIEEPE